MQGLSAFSQVASGFAAYSSAKANANIARGNAQSSLEDGAAQALQAKADYRAKIGQQVAAQGQSGFSMGSGSMLDALQESRVNQALAMAQIGRAAQARATIYNNQAAMSEASGENALFAGIISGASTMMKSSMDYANQSAAMGAA